MELPVLKSPVLKPPRLKPPVLCCPRCRCQCMMPALKKPVLAAQGYPCCSWYLEFPMPKLLPVRMPMCRRCPS